MAFAMSFDANVIGRVGNPCPPSDGKRAHSVLSRFGGHGVPTLRTERPV